MALQLGALREALIDAGASPAKADEASEELAAYENRLGSLELKIEKLTGEVNSLRGEMKGEFNAVRGEMKGGFQAIDGKFQAIDGRFQALEGKFQAIDGKFQAADGKSQGLEGKIDGLRSELRVYSLVMGVMVSLLAAGFWHSLPPTH